MERPEHATELIPAYGPDQVSVWRTPEGQYLQHTPAGGTVELVLDQAVTLAYRAPEAHDDRLPPALQSARHVRAAVLALAPPPVPAGGRPLRYRAGSVASRAAEAFHACKAVARLINTAQRDIRAHRAAAGNTVVTSYGAVRSRTDKAHGRAAEELEVSPSTLSEILSGR